MTQARVAHAREFITALAVGEAHIGPLDGIGIGLPAPIPPAGRFRAGGLSGAGG